MSPPQRRIRPSRLTSILGIFAGGVVAFLLLMLLWMLADPTRTVDAASRHAQQVVAAPGPIDITVVLAGGFLGFLVVGAAHGDDRWRRISSGIFALVLIAAGTVIGAAAGVVAYMLFWLGGHPEEAVRSLFTQVPQDLASGPGPALYLTVGGGLLGFAVTTFAAGNDAVKALARSLVGLVVGSVAGLMMYAVGYVAVNYPQIPDSPYYLLHMGEAIYAASPLEYVFTGLGATMGLLMARYSWRFYGVVTLSSLVSVILGFLMYSLFETLPRVDPDYKVLAIILFVCEAASLTMVVLYAFYTIDVATRKHWRKGPADAAYSAYFAPKVAFQVPLYNEPPELVLDTLRRLRAMDYPEDRFLIMALDDSTDPASSGPVAAYCKAHGIVYLHRDTRRGYKAGALNDSLAFVPDDVEFLAVVDADYHVAPNFLRETMGYLVNTTVAWVQTPQDYRNRHQSFLSEQYYLADAYFYRTVMPSRNEENTIIFCGTMGILRKDALLEVGGWGEKYISEDAELSLRLLANGYDSLYVNRTYGRGLIPATYEGYKKQHYRWAFGGAKILRGHAKDLLLGRLSPRQSFDFFVGSAHWFEGLFIFLIANVILLMALGEIFGIPIATHHSEEILLVGLVPIFLLADGITRLHMVMRESMKLSLGQTIRVLGMWMSVKFSNAFAAVKSFVGFHIPFIRTPKAPQTRLDRGAAFARAIRAAPFETTIASCLLAAAFLLGYRLWATGATTGAAALTRFFLLLWVVYYALIFLAAPLYAYKSYSTFTPDAELQASPRQSFGAALQAK